MKDLLNCPICDKPAKESCQMSTQRNVIGSNRQPTNIVSMKCKSCGYKITVQTPGKVTLIWDLWNVRDNTNNGG